MHGLTPDATLRYKGAVRQRLLRIAILLWIGWYVSGPVAETFDYWDTPHQEVHDIMFNAGGGVTVGACAFFLIFWVRNRRKPCATPQRSVCARVVDSIFQPVVFEPRHLLASNHSPPIPLRI